MHLIQRVQGLLLKPKDTWPVIAGEPASVASIYQNWVLILAAIPAVAGFIGMSVIGLGAMGFSYRVPLLTGLVQAVVSYGMSLAMVYLVALLVDALAPTFGGTRNFMAALKLVAYGCTAAFLGGIFSLLPSLSILGLLAALYSIYLFYTGLPVLMRNPAEKSVAYTAVVAAIVLVGGLALGAINTSLMAGPSWSGRGLSIQTPDGSVTVVSHRTEPMAKKMAAAGKQLETAEKAADADTAAETLRAGSVVNLVDIAILKALLPESLDALPRVAVQEHSLLGIGALAEATYRAKGRQIMLRIIDSGFVPVWVGSGSEPLNLERETENEIERHFNRGAYAVHEQIRKNGSGGEITIVLDNGFVVEAWGQQVDAAALRKAIDTVDLGQLEGLRRQLE